MTIRYGEDQDRTPYPSHMERMKNDGETIQYQIGETPSTIFIERIGPWNNGFQTLDIDFSENEELDFPEQEDDQLRDYEYTPRKPFTEWREGTNKRYPSYPIGETGFSLMTSWTYSKRGPIHILENWNYDDWETFSEENPDIDFSPPILSLLTFNLD